MATSRSERDEKTPVEEKSSFERRESSTGSPSQEQTLAYGPTKRAAPKARLPYTWQLVVIVLTCLCTCKCASYINDET